MRIVIDMQGAQTESRYRGIGRYTLSFTQAIARNCGEHEIILALSGLFPDTIEFIRAAFDGLLPQENIRVWNAPGPVRECEPENVWRRESAELIREAFLANLKPDVIHVTSLFEGYVDDAVSSIGRFDTTIPISVSLYDLIPLLNAEQYLTRNIAYTHYYHNKIQHLRRASLLLAISGFSRQEGLDHLGVSADSVINVSTAADANFHPLLIGANHAQEIRAKFGLTRPFVLYIGGSDERKNLPRLIHAYAQLSNDLRETHQLLIAGKIPDEEVKRLRSIAKASCMHDEELHFTGHIADEELAQLYNLCKLFVFPSWHEGFGLPALEAMSCGAAVIASNTSSLPEVINRDAALFDPFDELSISNKLAEVLRDDAFREALAAYGLEQAKKFSWDESARRAIAAFESIYTKKNSANISGSKLGRRLKLAFVSPLPPERSGIADYSAELLPALAKYYDIEVVVAQEQVSDTWVQANCPIRDSQWLRVNAHKLDRVLYQFGNSPFHQHMLDLLEEVPGTVVLHDFYLSGMLSYLELSGVGTNAWVQALYYSHGYSAVQERYRAENASKVIWKYPVNLSVLQHAQGVIVHSEHSRQLAADWYGKDFAADWRTIPLLRTPCVGFDQAAARENLGLNEDDFVICSFGYLDPSKLNHRLLEAWLDSRLAQDAQCVLVFVGENHGGEYGVQLLKNIRASGLAKRIRITGFVDMPIFRNYLAAADIAVQLRTLSRGETSAAVLDCMNYALPVVVNANGTMADLESDAVWMLPDAFENYQLVDALETLRLDRVKRVTLGKRAKEVILSRHAPSVCAAQYAEAIERFNNNSRSNSHALIHAIVSLDSQHPNQDERKILAQTIAQSFPERRPLRQLFLDVSVTSRMDLKTGIERVARSLVLSMLESPPAGFRVEPVYLCNEGGIWVYRYARRYTLNLLECPCDALIDEVVEPQSGDELLGLDISGQMLVEAEAAGLLKELRNIGVTVHFVVYDLLPVLMPQFFPPGADATHTKWLEAVAKFDGAICISKAVADELSAWIKVKGVAYPRPFSIGWFHLGSDVENSAPTQGMPKRAEQTLAQIKGRPSFLMVGTIEPRKGYLQSLEAFTQLWQKGIDVNLVIIGKEGWQGLPENARRTIPEIMKQLQQHPELGKRLFWLDGISDEYLEEVYGASACLIAASEGEGFGLPLVEAAQHGLPIIARDIPVFREVAGNNAYYFSGSDGNSLAVAVLTWIRLCENNAIPNSRRIDFMNWQASAKQLLNNILDRGWYQRKCVPSVEQKAMNEHLNLIHQARVNLVGHQLPQGDIILDLGGANCPLYKMGYPHRFKKLYLIDLPPDARCDMYKEVVIEENCDAGEVVITHKSVIKTT